MNINRINAILLNLSKSNLVYITIITYHNYIQKITHISYSFAFFHGPLFTCVYRQFTNIDFDSPSISILGWVKSGQVALYFCSHQNRSK